MPRTYKRLVPWEVSESCEECGITFSFTGQGRTRITYYLNKEGGNGTSNG